MFRHSPVLFAAYRDVHIELRLLHAPKGVLSELRLFDQSGGNRVLFLCERHSFVDRHEALTMLAIECRMHIDHWIEKHPDNRRQQRARGEANKIPRLPHGQEIR